MQEGYFKIAWSDIKNSPGWFGKVCLLGLISMIPVFGSIVLYGYAYGWARDIAWDVHRPMPAKIFGNEDGKLYSRGFYAWLILLIVGFIVSIVSSIAGDNEVMTIVSLVLMLALTMAANVCIMRAAIYGRLGAGFQLGRVWNMIRHDTNGLLRILGMLLLVGLVVCVIWCIVFAIVLAAIIVGGVGVAGMGIDWYSLSNALLNETPGAEAQLLSALSTLAPVIGIAMLLVAVLVYVLYAAEAFLILLEARAMGYWTRQFDVPHWGGQDDPMPFEAQEAQAKAAAQFAAAQQYQQFQQYQQAQAQAQAQAQQNPYAQPAQDQAAATQAAAPYQQPVQGQVAAPGQQDAFQQPAVQDAAQGSAAAPQGYDQAVPAQSPYVAPAPIASTVEPAQVAEAPVVTPEITLAPEATSATEAASTPEPPASEAVPAPEPPAYVGRPVDAPESAQVAYAPRWEKVDLDALEAQADAPQAASDAMVELQAPAYQGRPVEATAQTTVPLAPRWEKIDLDALNRETDAGAGE